MAVIGLAGCTQQAAPVVSGYDAQGVKVSDYTPYRNHPVRDYPTGDAPVVRPVDQSSSLRKGPVAPVMQEEDLNRIEPAGGDVAPVSNTPKAVFAPIEVTGNGTYTVQERDTLYKIARAHDVTARDLMAANNLQSTAEIERGMVLRIPTQQGTQQAADAPLVARSYQQGNVAVTSGMEESGRMPASNMPSSMSAVERAEAALAKLEGKREPEAPRVVAVDETKLEAQAAVIEPAAGQLPQTGLSQQATGPQFVQHQVAAGETVYRISKQYNASVIDIMAANDFQTPQDLKAGTMVRVPLPAPQVAGQVEGVVMQTATPETAPQENVQTVATTTVETKVEKVTTVTGAASPADAAKLAAAVDKVVAVNPEAEADKISLMQKGRIDPLAAKAKGLAWPVKGKIIKKYGEQGAGVAHTGINIAVPLNTPVLAAEGGSVLYAGNGLKTYGNLVLIRHTDGMVTAYGHNGKLLVAKGEKVAKGQVIALSGNSGNVGEPQVHFEIRKQAKAVDPLRVLASR